jgi:hypothetical protein
MANDVKRINEIFQGRIFRIPDYQRGYAWENKHRQAFWDDLDLLRQIGAGTHHYTGLIALETLNQESAKRILPAQDAWLLSGNSSLCLVVDGQQRLTTLIIFLHELLHRHAELSPAQPGVLNATTSRAAAENCYIRKENLGVPGCYGYIFGYANNPDLDKYFRSVILDDAGQVTTGIPTSAYARQLSAAKDFFRDKFKTFESPAELSTWFELVESRLLFNVFEVQDEFDVCLTFEAMNNRGKALSDLEKLKSRVLYLAGLTAAKDKDIALRDQKLASYRQVINDSWGKAYELLGWDALNVLDDDVFLQLAWVLRYGKPGTSRDQHLFSDTFTPQNAIKADLWPKIHEFSKDLAALAAPWIVVTTPVQAASLHKAGLLKKNIPDSIVNWLGRLSNLGATNFVPLVVAGVVHFQNDEIQETQLLELIKAVERYVFVVFGLASRASHTGRNAYLLEGSNLYGDPQKLDEIIVRLNGEIEWRFAPDLFVAVVKSRQIPDRDMSGFYGWDYLTYALYDYEIHLHETRFKSDGAKVDWSWIVTDSKSSETVEHIYPQTPKAPDWPSFSGLEEHDRELLLNSLGNLLLLSRSKNSSLQNDAFKKKASDGDSCYAHGSFSEIVLAKDYTDWTPEDIYKRTILLLDYIGQRWNVPNWDEAVKRVLDSLLKFDAGNQFKQVHDFVEHNEDRIEQL